MVKKISTLTKIEKNITYEYKNSKYIIEWKNTEFAISNQEIEMILDCFFVEDGRWYPLGASEDNPMTGGLGEYVRDELHGFSPRHASAIAAILVNEKYLDFKDKRPVYLLKR